MKRLALAVVLLALVGCEPSEETKRMLAAGYEQDCRIVGSYPVIVGKVTTIQHIWSCEWVKR